MSPPSDTGSPNHISENEMNECDRIGLHHIDRIQADSGHVLYWRHPSGSIAAYDALLHEVPWIRKGREDNANLNIDTFEKKFKFRKGMAPTAEPQPSLLGETLQDWIPMSLYNAIMGLLKGMMSSRSHRTCHFSSYCNKAYAISLSTTESDYSMIGMEIEEVDASETANSFFNTLLHLSHIMQCHIHEEILGTACQLLFESLGEYDRGMVYRFNDDFSGEIVHEIKHDHITSSYKGMRFPSSDIPLSARELYIRNGVRYIHNTELETVPIVSNFGEPVDLTQCRMRGVSKPHIIYMRNMGAMSSVSLAIIVNSKLWGLFAFHAYKKPNKPSLHQRIACETIISMVSVRIEAIVKKEQSSRIIQLGEKLRKLNPNQSVIQNLHAWGDDMLKTIDADVLVGHIQDPRMGEGDSIVVGDASLAPSSEFWTKLAAAHPNRELCVMSTRNEIAKRGLTQVDCPASGVIYFRQGRTHIMVGRNVRSKDVVWAGNPDEPKLRIGGILHPRNSFENYMEKARTESRSWTTQDLNVISVLRDHICEHSHNWMMELLRNDVEDTNRKYLLAIDRARDNYEFFAHMSHELRTPFHGVMGCLNILKDSMEEMPKDDVKDMVNTALSSGHHMINLLVSAILRQHVVC
jgi:two-component system, chemotaxis family, sensor kinase Cph1